MNHHQKIIDLTLQASSGWASWQLLITFIPLWTETSRCSHKYSLANNNTSNQHEPNQLQSSKATHCHKRLCRRRFCRSRRLCIVKCRDARGSQGPIVLDSRFVEPPLFARAHCQVGIGWFIWWWGCRRYVGRCRWYRLVVGATCQNLPGHFSECDSLGNSC